MQLSLTTTLPRHPRAAVLRPLVPLSREAAMSQLEQIAAASGRRTARQDGLGGAATLLAVVGGLIVLGAAAMWRAPAETVVTPVPAAHAPAMAPVATPTTAALPAPAETAPATEPPVPPAAPRESATEGVTAAVAAEPTPAVLEPPAEELAQRARARQLAEARRKAAALAQERQFAEEAQRLLAAARAREAERAAQQAEEQRRQRVAAADEAAARQAQPAPALPGARPGVREVCGGRGLFAESACLARECARAEHQADPVCVRVRESEEAQHRASIER